MVRALISNPKTIGRNRFKTSDNAAVYMEVYEPLLLSGQPPKVSFEYRIVDRKSGEKKLDVGVDDTGKAVQPGSPVMPVALKLPVGTLTPGAYRVEIRALESAGNIAPTRTADFQVE